MGNKTIFAGLLAACMLMPAAASAQGLPGELSANVALTTDYVFRGISQTDNGPAIQGGFDYTQDMFYIGTWGSSVDFGDDTTMELDIYAGVSPTINNINLDFGVIYYAYPDSPELATGSQDFVELYGGASVPIGSMLEVGGSVAYSPDFYGEIGDAFYYQLTAAVDLSEQTGIEGFGIDGGYGFSRFNDDMLGDDYDDWNIGVTASFVGLDFDLRYTDTTGLAGNDSSVVFTVSKSF
jgi:uncharacterized protein (TIGR02001 family)